MKMDKAQHQAIVTRLDKIQNLLQNLIILQGAQTELTKANVRKLARVGNNRMTEVWASAKGNKGK